MPSQQWKPLKLEQLKLVGITGPMTLLMMKQLIMDSDTHPPRRAPSKLVATGTPASRESRSF
jgi:hypothetical protein